MKIAFATCVQLGRSCVEEIFRLGGGLDLLITLRDERARNKSGRIYLDGLSREHGVPLLKIDNINEPAVIEALREREIDWLFIIGWSQIAKAELLNTPKLGCIGMHPTLLPQGRGRAAVPWAILKGLDRTGVTLFKLDEGVDTGDIIGQEVIPLEEGITATELYERVDRAHITLIDRYWAALVSGTADLHPQDETLATEWPGRKPEDGELTGAMTMLEADRMVRAVTHPYPGAFYREGNRILRIWSAQVSPEKGRVRLRDGWLEPIDFEVEGAEPGDRPAAPPAEAQFHR